MRWNPSGAAARRLSPVIFRLLAQATFRSVRHLPYETAPARPWDRCHRRQGRDEAHASSDEGSAAVTYALSCNSTTLEQCPCRPGRVEKSRPERQRRTRGERGVVLGC